MASESDLTRAVILACSKGGTRLFRQQSGQFWQGVVVDRTPDTITLRFPRAITVGVPGMSDLTGITNGGRYVAIETKMPDARTHPDRLHAQLQFIHTITRLGGLSGIVDSVEGARILLSKS